MQFNKYTHTHTPLIEAGAEEVWGRGGEEEAGCVEQREQWENPLKTKPDRENELSQTNRGIGEWCMGSVVRVRSKLLRALHAHRGKKLLEDLQNFESTAIKRFMVRFRGARRKGAMAFVECLGVSQEDTMKGFLLRETFGRSLPSHCAAERVDGICHGNDCQHETTRIHAISCTKTAWSSLIHSWVLHQALARSLRKSKVQFIVEDTGPFRERASGKNCRLDPLRTDIITEGGHSSTTPLDARIRRFYSTAGTKT